MNKYQKIFLQFLLVVCLTGVSCRQTTCNRYTDLYAPNNTLYTGYMDVGFNDNVTGLGFLFYTKFNATTPEEIAAAPTLIWLNGGPGASSMEGAFFENGPYRVLNISNMMVVEQNENAWTKNYNVLFIDQPIGVGFSRSAKDEYLPVNETQVAEQFYKGLVNFYTSGCYSNAIYHKSPLFITGESYCGKYIPNIAAEILKQNNQTDVTGNVKIPLKGISIGDPLLDPQNQLSLLGEYGIENNLISYSTYFQVNNALTRMKNNLTFSRYEEAADCYDEAMEIFMSKAFTILENPYNYKIGPYPDQYVKHFCQTYIQNFGFDKDHVYDSTSDKVANSLKPEIFAPNGIPALVKVLEQHLPVIIYNGNYDIQVNSPGISYAVNRFEWYGKQAFSALPMNDLQMPNQQGNQEVIGSIKVYDSFIYALINGAGHLAPYDQPESVNYLIDNFVNKTLGKQTTNQFRSFQKYAVEY